MTARHSRASNRTVFVGFMLVGFILFLSPARLTDQFRLTFFRTFGTTLQAGHKLQSLSSRLADDELQQSQLLQQKVTELENRAANLKFELDQERLRADDIGLVRSIPGLERMAIVHADAVVPFGADAIVLNRGQADGVTADLFVMVGNAVLGRVKQVTRSQAVVWLVTHKQSKIPVQSGPSNLVGMLVGGGDGSMHVRVRRQTTVSAGDLVYVQEQPGILDVPLLVGRVVRYQSDDEQPLLWDVIVEPAVNLKSITRASILMIDRK